MTDRKRIAKEHYAYYKDIVGIPTDPATLAINQTFVDGIASSMDVFNEELRKLNTQALNELNFYRKGVVDKYNNLKNTILSNLIVSLKSNYKDGLITEQQYKDFVFKALVRRNGFCVSDTQNYM